MMGSVTDRCISYHLASVLPTGHHNKTEGEERLRVKWRLRPRFQKAVGLGVSDMLFSDITGFVRRRRRERWGSVQFSSVKLYCSTFHQLVLHLYKKASRLHVHIKGTPCQDTIKGFYKYTDTQTNCLGGLHCLVFSDIPIWGCVLLFVWSVLDEVFFWL